MGSKSKAPKQPTTTLDTNLFGSATTSKSGATYNPTDFQSQFVGNAQNAMLNAQKAYNNRQVAQEAVDAMNRQYQTDFQNQLLSPALSKGWLRGSTAQDVATVADQDYQNRRYDLVNQEMNRNQQMLANNLANYLDIYNMMSGITGMSNALNQANSNYAMQQAQMNNANGTNWGQMLGNAAQIAGSAAMMSDIRVKENLEKLDTVDGINIYKFDYIDGDKNQIGVIAQEMQEKCPECVIDGEFLSVDYSKLPEKVQERIEELKNGK